MFEATIAMPTSRQYLLEHIHNKLAEFLQQAGGISTYYSCKDTVFLSVATNQLFAYVAKKQIVEAVAETLSLGYKNIYIRQKLGLTQGGFWKNLLVNTLSTLDNHADKTFVSTVLDADKPIFVEGYYNFALKWLKGKWQELVEMVQEGNLLDYDDQALCDFFRYLLQSQPHKTDLLTVTMHNHGYQLFTTSGKVVAPLYSLAQNATMEEEIALTLLCLNATNVKLCYKTKPGQEFCHFMQNLFKTQHFPLE